MAEHQQGPPAEGTDPLIGQLVGGKYRIVSVVARGGMGRVYKGIQEPLGRTIAVKILAPHTANFRFDDAHTKRFFREAAFSSRLNHPNTVVVHDYGTVDGEKSLFLVMEFLEGPTLRQVLSHSGALPLHRVIHIGKQICSSLADAHAAGVIHRDLKPPNILLVPRGGDPDFVKVVDFGLVKSIDDDHEEDLTIEGAFVGSPVYMSPEQALSQGADQRSDIYAVGILLYEMLAGRPPFQRSKDNPRPGEVIVAQVSEPPPALQVARPGLVVPPALEMLVMQCLAKKATDRPQSMEHLLDVLTAVERTLRTGAPRPAPAPVPRTHPVDPGSDSGTGPTQVGMRLGARNKRKRVVFIAAGLAALVVVGFAGAWYLDSTGKPTPAPTPETTTQAPAPEAPAPEAPATTTQPTEQPTAPAQPAVQTPPPVVEEREEAIVVEMPLPVIEVELVTKPEGAEIRVGDKVLGTTPLTLEVPPDELEGRTYTFVLEGYEVAKREASLPDDAETLHIEVELAAIPKEKPTKPTVVHTKPKKPKTGGPLDIKLTR